MTLRGVAPKAVEKRLKALFYGPAGAGKTTAAIQFPKPYLIDTERGAENDQYVNLLNKAGGAYFFTTDFDDLVKEVTALLSEKHDFRTLIIDPLTVPYNDLLDKAALSLATKDDPAGTAFGRHKAVADRTLKRLLNLLLRLDMNVIITSHQKAKWSKVGGELKEVGNTFDCYAKLDYLFDLVFEIEPRGRDNRAGIVRKTRVEGLPEGETFPFSYAEIAKRYGAAVLERKAEAQELATAEQVKTLARLVELLKVDEDVVEKWLSKAQATAFGEMPAAAAQKCIEWCEARVKGEEPAPDKPSGKASTKKAAEPAAEEVAHAV
jgi:hypothetical protein